MYQNTKQFLPACFSSIFTNLISIHHRQTTINYIHSNTRLDVKGLSSFKKLKFGIPCLRNSKIILSVNLKHN